MAQDFYAAFGVGPDDKHITTVDEGGVALAAIQGLSQKLGEKDAQIAELHRELNELKAQIQKVSEQVEQSKAAPQPAANVRNNKGL
jgi:chromosome segregation ATPase